MTIVAIVSAAAASAETWYLTKSSGSAGKGWSGDDAGTYWTDSQGNKGSGALVPTDTYWHKDGKALRAKGAFGGGNLWIGDLDSPDYDTALRMDGHVSNNNGFLKLAVGYASKSANSDSAYHMNAPIIVSPKDKPFGFVSGYSDVPMTINTSLTGDYGVGFVFGGRYNGSGFTYMTKTNVTLTVTAGLSQYHGDIHVLSTNQLISSTVGNVTFGLPPTNSDATLEIDGGAELKFTSVGEVELSGLTLHAGSRICIPYDSASTTTGVVRATSAFSLQEEGGTVQIRFSSMPDERTDDKALEFPLIVVPDTQTLDAARFELTDASSYAIDQRPVFRVVTNETARTKSLVAVFLGKGRLTVNDNTAYSGSGPFDTYTSALSDSKAASWSDGNMPHKFAIYEFGNSTGYGMCIRTPYDRTDDYTFPGVLLRTIGKSAAFVLADNTKTTVDFDLTSPLALRVVKSKDPTLDGTIQMGADVTSRAWYGSELTVASKLSGSGSWSVEGISGTSSPHSTISFTADNSGWTGTLSLKQSVNGDTIPGTANARHQKLVIANPAGLGGALGEFDYKALSLADCSELIVTNSVTLDGGLNRGIYVTNTATFTVDSGCEFVCNWPITFGGPLRKWGDGTLVLSGGARFLDSDGAVTNAPGGASYGLSVLEGFLKVLAHDAVNGVTVDLSSSTALQLPFNPEDADLKRYGVYNVETEVPFTEGKPIPMQLADVDADAVKALRETEGGYKQGLLTVKTSAAENARNNLSFNSIPGLRVIREDDAEAGTTTFSLCGKKTGFQLIVY